MLESVAPEGSVGPGADLVYSENVKLWLKICGVRRGRDARVAVAAGADAIGVNFSAASKRFATFEQAREVVAAVPTGFPVYGVFADAGRAEIGRTIEETGITGVQLHGAEPLSEALGWGLPVIFARKVLEPLDAGLRMLLAKPAPDPEEGQGRIRLLLDSPAGGGSGLRFDDRVLRAAGYNDFSSCIVAGGLTPANVGSVVEAMHPFGVDTAGGVETEPGMKESVLIEEFIRNARTA